jgi:hypothetical protein
VVPVILGTAFLIVYFFGCFSIYAAHRNNEKQGFEAYRNETILLDMINAMKGCPPET